LVATGSKDTTVPRLSGENQDLDGPLLGDPAIGDNSCWETMVALEQGAYPTVVPRNEISTTNASEYTHIKKKMKQHLLSSSLSNFLHALTMSLLHTLIMSADTTAA
jgi:hypothetical protein